MEKPLRFCDLLVKQIELFPYIDYRFLTEKYSRFFHTLLQNYTANISMFGLSSKEQSEAIQKEVDLWHKITKDYGKTVMAETGPKKHEKMQKILTVYRVQYDVNVEPQDQALFEEIQKTNKVRLIKQPTTEKSEEVKNEEESENLQDVAEKELAKQEPETKPEEDSKPENSEPTEAELQAEAQRELERQQLDAQEEAEREVLRSVQ